MRVRDAFILVIALVLIAPVAGNAQAPASEEASNVIVLFRDGVTPAERERLMRQSGGAATRHFRNVPASAARAGARARAFLERHPDVLSVVPDREVEKRGKPTSSGSATAGSSACAGHPSPVMGGTASYFTSDGAFDSLTGIGVSVSAPGEDREDINQSCFLKSVGILSTRLGGGTVRMSGTSMAAPHVTGVVALMAEQSAVTPDDARRRLRLGADAVDVDPLDSPAGGYSFDGEREGIVWTTGALSAQ